MPPECEKCGKPLWLNEDGWYCPNCKQAEWALRNMIARNDGGIDETRKAARLIAIERGFDGDDSNQVNERLSHE